MSEGAVGPVREDLLDHGVVAVVPSAWSIANGESVNTAW